jgi:AraC-like DNA-binding protein
MLFSNVHIKTIDCVVKYSARKNRWTAQNRKNHILGIKLSGNAEHIFSDHRFAMKTNCIYFLNQQEDYRVEQVDKGIAFSVHFTTYEPIDVKSFCIQLQDSGDVLRLLEAVEQQLKKGGCTARAMSDLYHLLDTFEEIYNRKYRAKREGLPMVQKYLLAHFKEKGCIAEAASLCGVSGRRFNDLFKAAYHITPNRYIINHKIAVAKKMLANKELSLNEVAELSGFSDGYYLGKIFKKETGQTPGAYRRGAEE